MSTLSVSNITDGTTTLGTTFVVNGVPKAWGTCDESATNFHDSFGLSSFTDNGTGNYTYAFTNAFDASRYCALGSTYASDGSTIGFTNEAFGSIRLRRAGNSGSASDGDSMAAFIGDLA